MAKTEWCVGDDGWDVRAVGRWVDRKTTVVDSLARMFATGMKNALSLGRLPSHRGDCLRRVTDRWLVGDG